MATSEGSYDVFPWFGVIAQVISPLDLRSDNNERHELPVAGLRGGFSWWWFFTESTFFPSAASLKDPDCAMCNAHDLQEQVFYAVGVTF